MPKQWSLGGSGLLRFACFVVWAVACPLFAQLKETPGPIERIRIVVGSPGEKPDDSSQQLLKEATSTLTAAGFAVVTDEGANSDAILTITQGEASMDLSPAPAWAPAGSTNHMGVRVSGNIGLRGRTSSLYSASFEGVGSCFINLEDKKSIEGCFDRAMREAQVAQRLKGMVSELWPERAALVAVLRPESQEQHDKGLEALTPILGGDKAAFVLGAFVTALGSSSPDVRGNATRALIKLRDPRSLDLLVAALGKPEAGLQSGAASVLGQLGDSRAVSPLLELLAKGSPEGQERAAEALGRLNAKEAVPALVGTLESASLAVQAASARALGQLKDPRAAEPLLKALEEGYPDVRRAAATGLGDLSDPRAVAPLVVALKDEAAGTRAAAAAALGTLGDQTAREPLLASLNDTAPEVRAAAARSLGQLGGAGTVQPLIRLVADATPGVRAAAALALGSLKDPKTVPTLEKALKKDRSLEVRVAAAEALGRMGTDEAARALNKVLKDRSPEVREAAARALSAKTRSE